MQDAGHSLERNHIREALPLNTALDLCYASKLTTVLLVGPVGAVWDAVTLRVNLADAGGGAALKVSIAVQDWKKRWRESVCLQRKCTLYWWQMVFDFSNKMSCFQQDITCWQRCRQLIKGCGPGFWWKIYAWPCQRSWHSGNIPGVLVDQAGIRVA